MIKMYKLLKIKIKAQRPILLILVISILFLKLWVSARNIIEPWLYSGHTVIQLILSGIIFAGLWNFIYPFWIKQNNKRHYILVGSVILLLTSMYYAKIAPLNNTGEGSLYPLWVSVRNLIEPSLHGGYIAIQLILLGIIFACLWNYIYSFWIKQNDKHRYILAGSVILLLNSIYIAKMAPLNFTGEGHLYPMLAAAFAHGQTYLEEAPDPALLSLPDPYDPVASLGLRLHDAVLFNGKYYLYFGPVPAVVLAAVNGLFRAKAGNDFLMNFFLSLCALMEFLIIYRIWQRKYQAVSWIVALICFVTVVWSYPVMWQLGRPAFYEAAISGGQAFLLTGLYLLMLALDEPKRQNLLFIGAGITLGLAVGARWNLAVAVILLATLVLILLIRPLSQQKLDLKPLLAFFVPLVMFAVMYGYYNFTRFGSLFEMGQQYQLAGFDPRKIKSFSTVNIMNNLIVYGIIPPADFSAHYPFITFPGIDQYIKYGVIPRPQNGYLGFESFSAIGWLAPLSMAWLYPVFGLFRTFPGFKPLNTTRLSFNNWLGYQDRLYSVILALAAFGCFTPLLFFFGVTMRYHMDYFPAIGLLAAIGILKLFSLKSGFLNSYFIKSFLFFLALYTVLLGAIASITGYFPAFAAHAPEAVNNLNALAKFIQESLTR